MKRGRVPSPSIDDVAVVVERIAVLMTAGVSPATSWRHVARANALDAVAQAASAADRGESIGGALLRAARAGPPELAHAWCSVAAAWHVATDAGAPLAASLRVLASSFRSIGEIQRELATGLAGPRATARMVMFLPLVGVAFGFVLGFDTLGTLLTTPPGLVCLVAGASLLFAGSRWNARMIASATPRDHAPGLAIDLTAIALTGGVSIERATDLVAASLKRYGLGAGHSDVIAAVLDLASGAGVPGAELLRSEAALQRRLARARGQSASAVLAVRLMIPLGICVLPSFMLLGVAPLVISVISSTFAGL